MKSRNLAVLATSLLISCNLSDAPTPSEENGVSISPRLMLAQGLSLPVTDSVHIKVWSTTPSNVWYEKTLQWSAKFVVISGIPQGTNFLFSIEGKKLQSDGSSAIWWSGNQTGATNSSQSLDPVDLPVWLSVGDTVAPTISGLRDTTLDSAVAGVRLHWTVSDNSLATVWLGSKKLTLTGNAANDTISVAVGGSTSVTVKAIDNAGNLSTKSVTIARKSKGTSNISVTAIPWNTAIAYDSLKDSRDGKRYRTVVIGSQKWMAENLNYSGAGSTIGTCYNNNTDSCTKYGRLYTWSEVMAGSTSSSSVPSGTRGVCPSGWHVPSDGEWHKLAVIDSDSLNAAQKLKASSGWGGNLVSTDEFGFRALPGGFGNDNTPFGDAGNYANWWTSSSIDGSTNVMRGMGFQNRDLGRGTRTPDKQYSVRCVNDTSIGSALPISKDSVLPPDANTIGLWNFNEGSGSSIRNAVTGSASSLSGGYSWIDGYFGKAVQFDGVSGYANLNFNPPETNSTYEMVVNIQKDTGWLFTLWGAYNSGIALETNGFLSPEFMSVWSMTQPHLNQSVYLALTIDSNKMGKLYINGVLAGSGTALDSYSWGQIVLASYTGTSGFVKCSFEKFRISSKLRDALEIQAISQKIGLTQNILK